MKTDNLIERLEAYRKGNRISKSEMARILGANHPEQYFNWLARNSLPKAYYDAALRILGQPGSLSKDQAKLISKIESLSPRDRAVVEQMIDSFLKAD